MALLPEPITVLIAALARLPGIGPRSAERLALHLVQTDTGTVSRLAEALVLAKQKVDFCRNCGALTDKSVCDICSDSRRDASLICVVERAVDIISIEKSHGFQGRYHVLGGKISPLNGVDPEDLRIADLEARLTREPVEEVILALGTDVEGDATSHYISTRLASRAVKVSRIAQGLPAGSGLEFADEITLGRALQERRPLR
ncbi:MAG: recombination protein RecR [Opitutaceae bacterium]|nr:recombination protein RecR [Verrucomicrobiales bacterium]